MNNALISIDEDSLDLVSGGGGCGIQLPCFDLGALLPKVSLGGDLCVSLGGGEGGGLSVKADASADVKILGLDIGACLSAGLKIGC